MSLVASFAVLAMAGCGAMAAKNSYSGPQPASPYWRDEAGVYAESPKPAPVSGKMERGLVAGATGGDEAVAQPAAIERKIIYTGAFWVDVYDVKQAQDELVRWVGEQGGYMEQLAANRLVLRIPADRFPSVEPKLEAMGRIDDSLTDIRAQDITAEYYDVELRLKTKRDYLASLQKLLDAAGSLKDKLAVQKEIASVVEEIEVLEGRLRLLSQQVALATVTVTFRLATSGPKRTFQLPWEWLDLLGTEYLVD
jgi:hypothetical protein